MDTVQKCFLTQHIDFATHSSGTKPDLVLSSDRNVQNVIDVGKLGCSDHSMILVQTTGKLLANTSTEEVPDWNKADMQKLHDDLQTFDWETELKGLNAKESWDKFKEKLHKVQEDCVPKKKRRINNRPIWMTRNIMRIIRKKRRLWRVYKQTKDYREYLAYKKVENTVQRSVRQAKRKFERNLAKEVKKSPKAFYSYLKTKTANKETVGPLKDGDVFTSDDDKMAGLLNEFFSSIFTTEDVTHLPVPKLTYTGSFPLHTVDFRQDTIEHKLAKLRTSSAPGPDKICPRLLQSISDVVSYPLAIIFTRSLEEGEVPADWKRAHVAPIFKKGNKSDVGNYRPISLTCILCKIMESIVRDVIMTHLTAHYIILPSQHGFMSRKSCLTNLLEYLEVLTKFVDEGYSVDVIYLDFAKAFDKVPHHRLNEKLKAAGISGCVLKWISEWLCNRKQRVVLNGKCSDWKPVDSGVPQGSVLGPTLFIIFINDIDGAIDAVFSIISKFADDTKIIRIVQNDHDRESLQEDINNIFAWSEEWQMLFNSTKCKVIHFGKKNPKFSYTIGGYAPAGTILESVENEKDLGVIIHQSLKPSSQCAKAASKANQVLGQMARAFSYRDKDTWIRLYKGYVRPHLEYSVQAWSPWTEADIELLEAVQKRAVRMVTGLKSRLYEERLQEVNLTTLRKRRQRGDMIAVWKILNGQEDVKSKTWFTMAHDNAARLTRHTDSALNLVKPRANLEIRSNFFSVRSIDSWNSLPDTVRSATTVNNFKTQYDRLSV